MNNHQTSKETIIGWLKRIFSLQTIAVVVGIIAAIYAIKTYKDNHSGEMSLDFYYYRYWENHLEKTDVHDKDVFENLIATENGVVSFGDGGYSNSSWPNGIPCIQNKSSNSIKNFRLEIEVYHEGLEIDQNDIYPDYEIQYQDTINHHLLLRYKYDVLNGNSSVPTPISRMHLPDSIPLDSMPLWEKNYDVHFAYRIVYDGIPKPCQLYINYTMCFGVGSCLTEKQIDDFLSKRYNDGCFDQNRKRTLVTVIDCTYCEVMDPPKKLTEAKFEDFKKDFIANRGK